LAGCLPNFNNLDIIQAMHGYNPFKADAMASSGDPGIMNGKIFYAQCQWFDGAGYSDFISLRFDRFSGDQ